MAKLSYSCFETNINGVTFGYKKGENGVTSITKANFEDDILIKMDDKNAGPIEVYFQLMQLPYYVLGKA